MSAKTTVGRERLSVWLTIRESDPRRGGKQLFAGGRVVPDRQSETEDGGTTGETGREKKKRLPPGTQLMLYLKTDALPVYLPEHSFVQSPQHASIPRESLHNCARHNATCSLWRPVRTEKQFSTERKVRHFRYYVYTVKDTLSPKKAKILA